MPRKKTFDEQKTLSKIGHLFWSNGYAATGVDLISEHVSLKKTSIYNAYGDKASLFKKVLNWYTDEVLHGGLSVLKGEAPVSDEIATLLHNSLVHPPAETASQGCLMLNSLMELKHTEPDLYDHVCSQVAQLPETIESYLKEAHQAGRIAPSADVAALSGYVFSILQGLQVQLRAHNATQTDINKIISVAMMPIKELERTTKNETEKRLINY